ncbi:senescence-associated carboxylesterase 101-like, partial [Bidens hawaiensis]|uniref:senescence-associated carboxylesterase 101-like n=1 Tax=Bidens hawaiensis TaxID=980011 RepID=UPI00404907E9
TCRFSSEVELGKFLGSTGIIPDAYRAISETNLAYEIHTTRSGTSVLAFKCFPDYTNRFLDGEFGLVSSENHQVVEFILTKVNSSFKINEAAVELFQNLGDDLKELENKYVNTSLIITGSGLGGYLAILSTLRLHHAIDVEESKGVKNIKRPICITFGSPLVGDANLQGAIAERPQWKSCFLNVVARKDPVATFFSLNTEYKPFGTFLFCTESGGHTAFEDQDSILPVLDAMKLLNAGNLQIYDYTNVLSSIRRKLLYRGVSELSEFNLNLLRAGITLQLKEVGVLKDISNEQFEVMEKKQIKMIKSKTIENANEPTRKLNNMKISLTYMEWYMKKNKLNGVGYYDSYKNDQTRDEMVSHQEILRHHRFLNQYWKKIIEEKNLTPQKEGTKLRTRWLLGGTNYRRIVEPLDITEYYKENKVNYIENRPNHYKLLEKWLDEGKDPKSSEVKRNKAASLTEDSCFWARVEEALIALRDLVNGGSADIEQRLEEFEAYVMTAINNFSVSPEIFLNGSSLMKWWNEYKAYKGTGYASEFAQYMNHESYTSYH